jgi:WhiB family redox-sensing transcriptional regulator
MSIIGDLEGLINREPWTDGALCTQVDSGDLFFPEKGGSTVEAKRICNRCDVTAECLAYALKNKIARGIWGAKSERERRDMLKRSA